MYPRCETWGQNQEWQVPLLLLFSLCSRWRPRTRDRDSCTVVPLSLLLHVRPGWGRSSTSFSSAGLLLTTLSSVFCFPDPSRPVPSLWLSSLLSSSSHSLSPTTLSSFPSRLHCLTSFFLILFLLSSVGSNPPVWHFLQSWPLMRATWMPTRKTTKTNNVLSWLPQT